MQSDAAIFPQNTRDRNANSIRTVFGVGKMANVCVSVRSRHWLLGRGLKYNAKSFYSRFYLLDSNGKWLPKSHNRFSPNHLSINSVESEMCKSGSCAATRCLDFMKFIDVLRRPGFRPYLPVWCLPYWNWNSHKLITENGNAIDLYLNFESDSMLSRSIDSLE